MDSKFFVVIINQFLFSGKMKAEIAKLLSDQNTEDEISLCALYGLITAAALRGYYYIAANIRKDEVVALVEEGYELSFIEQDGDEHALYFIQW